jgi:preprotein translocase subunit SecA
MSQQLGSFEKILRVGEGRRMKRLGQQAAYITSIEPEFQALSDEELRDKTVEFRQRLENGEALEELLFEAFAAVREARLRESDQRMFDVQLMGGIVLHEGDVAEMKTGEERRSSRASPSISTRSRDRASTSSPSTTTSRDATPIGTAASMSASG